MEAALAEMALDDTIKDVDDDNDFVNDKSTDISSDLPELRYLTHSGLI